MPAPPLESEPAMVTAIAVMRVARRSSAPSTTARRFVRGLRRIGRERQRRNHRHAVGAGRDHIGGIAGIDAGNAADRKSGLARAHRLHDIAQAGNADRRRGVVLRAGRDRPRRCRHSRSDRAARPRACCTVLRLRPMMAVRPSSSRASAAAMSSWPICTPSASAASATSTRSLISSGMPSGSSTPRSARASSTMARVPPCLSRNCTSVALPAMRAARSVERAPAGDRRDRQAHRAADRLSISSPLRGR